MVQIQVHICDADLLPLLFIGVTFMTAVQLHWLYSAHVSVLLLQDRRSGSQHYTKSCDMTWLDLNMTLTLGYVLPADGD